MTKTYLYLAIFLASLVTWLPRILPYFIIRLVKLPDKMVRFFNYLPISIIFALILSSLFSTQAGQIPQVKWPELIALLPSLGIMLKTRNVMLTVLVGCVTMGLLRFFF